LYGLVKEFRRPKLREMPELFTMEQKYFPDNHSLQHWCIGFIYEPRFTFVCTDGDRMVGFVRAEKAGEDVEIRTLCVIEEFGGQGVGRKLMEQCIESIRESEGGVGIRLMVSEKNRIAKRLYEKLGFQVFKREEKVYFDGSNGYVMYLRDA